MMQSLYTSHHSVMMFARHQMDSCTRLSQSPRETSPLRASFQAYRDYVLSFHVVDIRSEEWMDTHVLYCRRNFRCNSVGDSALNRRQVCEQCSVPHALRDLDRSFYYGFHWNGYDDNVGCCCI